MRCIEMYLKYGAVEYKEPININMRCIEIDETYMGKVDCNGLTLTWDVLKFKCIAIKIYSIWD